MSIFHIIGVGITCGFRATTGAFVIYLIAKKLGRFSMIKCAKIKRIKEKQIILAEKWFSKYGDKKVLFGRMIPGIRELVSIPAGILNMRYNKFFGFTFTGSCSWSMGLTAVRYYFGAATIELF